VCEHTGPDHLLEEYEKFKATFKHVVSLLSEMFIFAFRAGIFYVKLMIQWRLLLVSVGWEWA
jgi:hypothetical protein